ncbi:hypothetical protein ANCDUO_04316 [Ancylostoma duodenale]|uniref:Integrase zinc-binding domain-containing protein n=1 Tax=Ancylostoma duodenale TaxID=51022 RepID=A0A0C2DRL1_9BILA|nr:hypothetical protein ANCDUO_04316 [Ancylostoma duodenale]
MKMLARDYCLWTNIEKEIENKVKSCRRCQEYAKNPIKNTLCSWPIEDKTWIRVHADFAGPIEGRMFLIIVDAYSKWPELETTGTDILDGLLDVSSYAMVSVHDVQVDDRLWRRQANQLRPATHTTADSKLMDEFDFPLLLCVNDDPPIQDSSTTYRKDRTSTTPLPTPVPVHRPSRTQRPQLRLQVDPRRKTSTTDDSLTREVL